MGFEVYDDEGFFCMVQTEEEAQQKAALCRGYYLNEKGEKVLKKLCAATSKAQGK